jgi:hypothetical protein
VDIESLGERFHYGVVFWSSSAAVVTVAVAWWLGRRLVKMPGARQTAAELLVEQTSSACSEAFGDRCRGPFVSLLGTVLLFAVVSNVIGLIPLHAITLGLFPEHGLEIGGDPYRDFNDDHTWQAGEPAIRGEVTDWGPPRRLGGLLIPSGQDGATGTSLPLQLSVLLAGVALASAAFGRWVRTVAEDVARPGWRLLWSVPVSVPKALWSAVRLCSRPMGGALLAILVGGALYNALLYLDVGRFALITTGLAEVVVLAIVRRTRDRSLASSVAPAAA